MDIVGHVIMPTCIWVWTCSFLLPLYGTCHEENDEKPGVMESGNYITLLYYIYTLFSSIFSQTQMSFSAMYKNTDFSNKHCRGFSGQWCRDITFRPITITMSYTHPKFMCCFLIKLGISFDMIQSWIGYHIPQKIWNSQGATRLRLVSVVSKIEQKTNTNWVLPG